LALSWSRESADDPKDVIGVGPKLDIAAHGKPAHDPITIDHDSCRSWDILALGAASGMDEAIASGYRQVAVGDEPVTEPEPAGDLLALLVGIGRHRDDLNTRPLGLR
jgi:hypothetical protein